MYAGRLALAVIVTALLFFPVYWLIVSSLKTQQEMRLAVPTFWPQTFSWSNYAEAFRIIPYARFFGNTLLMSAGIVVLQLNVALLAAFAFAKGSFRGKEVLFFLVLAAMIVPDQVTFVPVYVMMSKLNWLDTFWALIIPHGASAYGIFLLRQAFKSVNNDVLEAARVDGGGRLTLLYRILLPMTMPTVVTLAVLQFISAWNSYFWPPVSWRLCLSSFCSRSCRSISSPRWPIPPSSKGWPRASAQKKGCRQPLQAGGIPCPYREGN